MTDQNYAYRPEHDSSADEDPLAELARIVAGEPAPVRKSPAPQAVDPRSFEIETDLDIEAELMRELGEAEPGRTAVEESTCGQLRAAHSTSRSLSRSGPWPHLLPHLPPVSRN